MNEENLPTISSNAMDNNVRSLPNEQIIPFPASNPSKHNVGQIIPLPSLDVTNTLIPGDNNTITSNINPKVNNEETLE